MRQGGQYPYVYVDGLYLRRNWGGEVQNVAILVAIAVNEDGYREVLCAAEGMKEDKASGEDEQRNGADARACAGVVEFVRTMAAGCTCAGNSMKR